VPSPDVKSYLNVLNGVSCVSPTACTAVGYDQNEGTLRDSLIESWNGKKWSVVPSQNPGPYDNPLEAVSCVSATACTAVGYSPIPHGVQTLVEAWNGAVWQTVSSPNTASAKNYLLGVSCVSASACTAVGQHGDAGAATLVESWNGHQWSVVSSPDESPRHPPFDSLSAVWCATTGCIAVGAYVGQGGQSKTLVESSQAAS
jgi:hypothetical protein